MGTGVTVQPVCEPERAGCTPAAGENTGGKNGKKTELMAALFGVSTHRLLFGSLK